MGPVFNYLENNSDLDVVCAVIGRHRFVSEMAWDGFYGRVSAGMDVFYTYQEAIEQECGLDISCLVKPVEDFEEFIFHHFLTHLSEEVCNDFQENGFVIKKWLSPTQAIIESTDGTSFPSKHPRARLKASFGNYVGFDPGHE